MNFLSKSPALALLLLGVAPLTPICLLKLRMVQKLKLL